MDSLPMLQVPDEIVIAFFTSVVVGMATAIAVLWKRITKLEDERHHRPKEEEQEP